jgi:hypothetical protein
MLTSRAVIMQKIETIGGRYAEDNSAGFAEEKDRGQEDFDAYCV